MTMTDPIADMLTIIRNANAIYRPYVDIPLSKTKVGIAIVLKEEGYVGSFEVIGEGFAKKLRVHLKYGPDGERVIQKIERASKPGRRIYRAVRQLPRVLNGMGTTVFSTPRGILSGRQCKEANVGGEWLFKVY